MKKSWAAALSPLLIQFAVAAHAEAATITLEEYIREQAQIQAQERSSAIEACELKAVEDYLEILDKAGLSDNGLTPDELAKEMVVVNRMCANDYDTKLREELEKQRQRELRRRQLEELQRQGQEPARPEGFGV